MEILVSQVNGRPDKNDVLLQDLVEAKSWKQALSQCDKRLKKNKEANPDKLLVNKAFILISTEDEQRRTQAEEELKSLFSRKPSLADLELICAIDDLLEHHDLRWELKESMWTAAATASSRNEDLYQAWFGRKFQAKQYEAAQKAAMTYSRNFPQKRQPFFWNILACHLASIDSSLPDEKRTMFGRLASGMLNKAAIDTRSESLISAAESLSLVDPGSNAIKPASNNRTLQTPGDIQFVVAILHGQAKFKEALHILDDFHTGLGSRIAHNSWELVKDKITMQQRCEMWEEQWAFCSDLLCDARNAGKEGNEATPFMRHGQFGDDWTVWSALLEASSHIPSASNRSVTKTLISSFLSERSWNAQLALVEFHFSNQLEGNDNQDSCLSATLTYYQNFSDYMSCFRDLRHVYMLSVQDKKKFLAALSHAAEAKHTLSDHAESNQEEPEAKALQNLPKDSPERTRTAWLMAEINALKQDYYLVITVKENVSDPTLLSAFVSNCLRLYQASLKVGIDTIWSERRPGDDAAILAAMGCVHLYRAGRCHALIRAVLILEILLAVSKHNYDALVMLVRIYIYLGAMSLALKYQGRLELKHVQNLTLSWSLLTRMSTFHPKPSKDKLFRPADLLKKPLDWFRRGEEVAKNATMDFLEKDSYYNLLDQLVYRRQTENSIAKYILVCELVRISRANNENDASKYLPMLEKNGRGIEDTRDMTFFPNYEAHGQPRMEQLLRPGPLPGKSWLALQSKLSSIHSLLTGTSLMPLANLVPFIGPLGTFASDDLTEAEGDLSELVSQIQEAVTDVASASATSAKEPLAQAEQTLKQTVVHINNLFNVKRSTRTTEQQWTWGLQLSTDLSAIYWYTLHTFHTNFEIYRLLLALAEYISVIPKRFSSHFKGSVAEAIELKKAVSSRCKEDIIAAKSTLQDLQQPSFVDKLMDLCAKPIDETDEVGNLIEKSIDRDHMRNLCIDLAHSWQDSLDGVVSTKLD